MKVYKVVHLFLAYLLILGTFIHAEEIERLKTSDIHKIMQQILAQHLGEKSMNEKVIKQGMKIYINQFDPFRIYLLDEEVKPYIDPSPTQLAQDVDEYTKGQYNTFKQLNDVIQKAIVRARQIREAVEKDPAVISSSPNPSASASFFQDPDLKLSFAKNPAELHKRIQNHIQSYIAEEKKKYGADKINKNMTKTLLVYNKYFENIENGYLFVNAEGQPLSAAQQESLFTLHVLKALAGSLDAHTTFYNKAEAYDIKVHLEKGFEGVGLVLEQAPNGSIMIKDVIEGGPAAKEGHIKPRDQLLSVDRKSLENKSLQEVMELLRGKKGTSVALELKRKNADAQNSDADTYQVSLMREEITLNDDRAKYTYENFGDGIIGKITLNSFYQGDKGINSAADIRNAIKELKQKGNLKGLILDLRDNGGGFLSQAVDVAGLFITNGVVVISKYSDGNEHIYRDMDNSVTYNGPLVVLTSKATASAAEIVAQALQDYGVALVVGDDRTYGKGTIQSQTVTDDSATSFFKVTVGEYYTVSGNTPQIKGVKADIVVPGKLSEEHIGEKYLENAISGGSIPPEYKDDLKDIDPGLKGWYLRYYYATLQPKIDKWRNMLPVLQKNSQYRIEHNKNYQTFIHQLKGLPDEKNDEEAQLEEDTTGKAKKDFGVEDLQLAETVNIVKDMIMFNAREGNASVASDGGK